MKSLNQISIVLLFFLFLKVNVFGAFISIDKHYPDKWNKTPDKFVKVPVTVESVVPNQEFNIYTLFTSDNKCFNEQGKTDVVMDLKIISPDGSEYFHENNLTIHNTKVITRKLIMGKNGTVQSCLGEGAFTMRFNENDNYGKYKIFVTMKDLVGERTTESKYEIKLEKFKVKKRGKIKVEKVVEWMREYCVNPNPVTAFNVFLDLAGSKSENLFSLPFYSFFSEIFKDNDFLVKKSREDFSNYSKETRRAILTLLRYMNYDAGEFDPELTAEESEYIRQLNSLENPMEFDIPSKSEQLDIIWHQFYATGKYEPIKKIASSLVQQNINSPLYEEVKALLKGNLQIIPYLSGYLGYYISKENMLLSKDKEQDLLKVMF